MIRDEILAEFGYDYAKTRLQLPMAQRDIPGLDALKAQIEETLPYVQLTSESAKREVLNRQTKRITQDIGGYRVPDDVAALVKTLVGILEQD